MGWENDDQVVADWLLFHVAWATPEDAFFVDGACRNSGRLVSVWLCPDHARKYGWKNLDLCKVKRDSDGELSEKEREAIADVLELLRREDPEAFDLEIDETLEAMRERDWSISSTLILPHGLRLSANERETKP